MSNPLLDFSGLPHFDIVCAEDIDPAIEQLLAEAKRAIDAAECVHPVTWDTFITPLDSATERLGRAWNQISHLQAVLDTHNLRDAYNSNLPKLIGFGSAIAQNMQLFLQYQRLTNLPDYVSCNDVRRKLTENALREFRLGGAELESSEKVRLSALKQEIAELSARFEQNVLDATDSYALFVEDEGELAGLPPDLIAKSRAAAKQDGKLGFKLGLARPCYLPVLRLSENRNLRQSLYRANATRASEFDLPKVDNSFAILRILELRAELACLLGFSTYADYSLATKMAKTPDEVLAFLRDLAARAKPFAQRGRDELEVFARECLGLETLEAWDIDYASEKFRQIRYNVSAQEVRQYFTEPAVLAGLFELIHSLYGLNVLPDHAPLWHPDARFYRLVNSEGTLVGQFYLDLYARAGKRGGAWMEDCRNRRDTDTGTQTPLVYLVCNFGRGSDGKPATFSHEEVKTLFHEMGHGLHQLLTQVGELGVAGLNGVEWDAVELPSQFMENFCWEWDHLQRMTAHVDTGSRLPRHLFDKMLEARNYQSGMATLHQVELAIFDMELHSRFDSTRETLQQLLNRVREEVAVNIPPVWSRSPNSFTHIFGGGYAAGYYSYKWAEVLSADVYAAFEEAPEQLEATGARFRNEILGRGGSRSALENFCAFRGREPSIDALLRHSGFVG